MFYITVSNYRSVAGIYTVVWVDVFENSSSRLP